MLRCCSGRRLCCMWTPGAPSWLVDGGMRTPLTTAELMRPALKVGGGGGVEGLAMREFAPAGFLDVLLFFGALLVL